MNRDEFVRANEPIWKRTEDMLDQLDKRQRFAHELADFPELYRRCCHHLALSRQRHYEASLEARLNQIALRGYHQLYGRRRSSWRRGLEFLGRDFPRLVRAHAAYFWLVTVLFYGPGIAMAILVLGDPNAVYSLLSPDQAAEMEEMYRVRPTEERGAAADFFMFGFYISHNIGIAFRTFAGGFLFGLGTLFFVIFNGLFLGAVMAHLVHTGGAFNLLTFVITHGAFELTAIVLAGVAGLRLGAALLAPGRLSRGAALRKAAPICVQLVLGVAAMLLIAAFVEAFWSSTTKVPPMMKIYVGSAAWLGLAAYLFFGGRGGGRGAGRGRGRSGEHGGS